MSKLKGMVVFAVSEPLEDGRFFIKKSILDGSLAIFDEEKEANRQLRRNGIQGNVVNELIVVRAERAANVNSELKALTEINRLQSEENKQLQQDKAELLKALEVSTRAWDQYFKNGEMFDYDEYESHEELLEKHKCD